MTFDPRKAKNVQIYNAESLVRLCSLSAGNQSKANQMQDEQGLWILLMSY